MKDTGSLHARLQEYNDCFAEADPNQELRKVASWGIGGETVPDMTDLALKYLSLAILAGVESQAEKIFFTRNGDQNGSCTLAGREETRLPTPPTGVAKEIIQSLRKIAGLEPDKAYGSLVCGIRDDRLVMDVGVARAGDLENLSLTILKV